MSRIYYSKCRETHFSISAQETLAREAQAGTAGTARVPARAGGDTRGRAFRIASAESVPLRP